jgi:hypothetical protein
MGYFLEKVSGFGKEGVVLWSSFSGAGLGTIWPVGDRVCGQCVEESVEMGAAFGVRA